MNGLVAEKLNELVELCVKHQVRTLEIFGSGASQIEFDRKTSDLDFLVEFMEMPPAEHADAYFGMLEDLQTLFDLEIDLVERKAITNPFFRESIDKTRRVVYAA